MVEIIEENRPKSFSERLLSGVGRAASEASTEIPRFFGQKMLEQERKARQVRESEQLSKLIGQDVTDIQDPNIKKAIVENLLKGQAKKPDMGKYLSGLETIQRMRKLGETGKLGRGSKAFGFFGGPVAKNRAEYEQLGKSLIQLATTIPIRNQMEFETLSEKLFDPSLLDSEREGILNAMEHIIRSTMGSIEGFAPSTVSPKTVLPSKERPPLSSFAR